MELLKLLIWQLETQKMLQPLTPSPPHVTNNGKHVQIIKILGGENIKLGWGIYTPDNASLWKFTIKWKSKLKAMNQ